MQIRKAKPEDLNNLIQLLHQLSPSSEEPDKEKLKQILNNTTNDENHYLIVLEQEGEVIATGMLLVRFNLSHGGSSVGYVENIVVDEKHRKKGFGLKIVKHLIKKAKEKNCYKITLNCKKSNIPFYEKCGLKETGEVYMRLDL